MKRLPTRAPSIPHMESHAKHIYSHVNMGETGNVQTEVQIQHGHQLVCDLE